MTETKTNGIRPVEAKALKMLVAAGKKNIKFKPTGTPDFTYFGGAVEVKQMTPGGHIEFYPTQFNYLRAHPEVEVWIFLPNNGELTKQVRFSQLDESREQITLGGVEVRIIKTPYRRRLRALRGAPVSFYVTLSNLEYLDAQIEKGIFESRSAALNAVINQVRQKKEEVKV